MEKARQQNQKRAAGGGFFFPLLATAFLVCVAVMVLLPIVGETPETYTDIIIETPAAWGANKSGELALFWCCMLAACLLLPVLDWLLARRRAPAAQAQKQAAPQLAHVKKAALMMLPNVVYYLVTARYSLVLLLAAVTYSVVGVLAEKYAMKAVLLMAFTYYGLCALLAVGCLLGWPRQGSWDSRLIGLVAGGLVALCLRHCIAKKDELLLDRVLMALQCIIPFALSIYLLDRYLYQDELLRIPFPPGYIVLVAAGLLALLGLAIRSLLRLFRSEEPQAARRLIFLSTVITIFVFNSYVLPAQFFQTDAWHHGEQMIPWQQIATQGLSAYGEYSPVSGLFPMVIGFFQNVLFGETTTAYPAALSMLSVLFAVVTIVLCYYCAGSRFALAVAVLFSVPVYNRQYMVLPVLLLLALPKLVQRRALWLAAWVFGCFVAVLYYPLFGVAVAVGTLPFAVVQLVALFKNGELRQSLRRPSTYLAWAACLATIALCLPLLLRMARHVLTYSSQTVLADGIPVYGSEVNGLFLPYLESAAPGLRTGLYYGARFALPVLGALLFLFCTLLYLRRRGSLWQKLQHPAFYCFSSGFGVLLVSYTYTQVREENYALLSRSGPVMLAVVGIFFSMAVYKYGGMVFARGGKAAVLSTVLGLSLVVAATTPMLNFPSPVGTQHANGGLQDDGKKLTGAYTVPEGFIFLEDSVRQQLPRLGSGFIAQHMQDSLLYYHSILAPHIEAGRPVANLLGYQMFYYPLNAKAVATGNWAVSRSGQAQQAIFEVLDADHSTVGVFLDSQYNYYLYYQLFARRGCVFSPNGLILFPELAQQLAAEGAPGYILPQNHTFGSGSLGNVASSLGKSMESLSPRFTTVQQLNAMPAVATGLAPGGAGGYTVLEPSPTLQLELPAPTYGADADFLYLEFAASIDLAKDMTDGLQSYYTPNKKGEQYLVRLYWATDEAPEFSEERMFTCYYGDGRLLLPLGSSAKWLLAHNTHLKIELADGFAPGDEISLAQATLLKLNMDAFEE